MGTWSHIPQGEGVDDQISEQLSPEETDHFKRFFYPFFKKKNNKYFTGLEEEA